MSVPSSFAGLPLAGVGVPAGLTNGAEWIIVAGKPRDWADDSCAMGVDALDFLTRTREKLA